MEQTIKVKMLDKECTVYQSYLIAAGHMNVHNNETLAQFLSLIYNEQFANAFMILYDLDDLSKIIEKTYSAMAECKDLTIEVPNNFKEINKVYNAFKKGEQEYGTQIL